MWIQFIQKILFLVWVFDVDSDGWNELRDKNV